MCPTMKLLLLDIISNTGEEFAARSAFVAYQGFFLIYGKTWTLSLSIKRVISNLSTITNIVLSGPLVQTFFKGWYIKCIWIFCTKWSILNPYQSSFRPPDSGISQLLLITYEIYQNFDSFPPLETQTVFLDMWKAFNKVWCEAH